MPPVPATIPNAISNGFRSLARLVGFNPDAAPEDANTPPDLDTVYTVPPEALILGSFANYLKPIAPNEATSLKREGSQDLRLYDRLLDDDVAMSCLQQRRLAITSRDWEVTPGDDEDPRSVQAADDFRAMLKALRFDVATAGLHYSVWYGYGVAEALWTTREHEGRRIVWLDALIVPDRRWFGFTIDGELRYTAALGLYGEEVPPNKFVVVRTGGTHDFAFYGLGLAHWAYWPIWFKRVALKFWALYLEKLANPTAVGEFKESDSQKDKNKLTQALLAIGRDSAVILPEGAKDKVSFMEAQRTGAGSSSYKDFVIENNEALMRIILGQPGTSKATPQGIGSGQAEVHEGVKAEIVKADSDLICEAINDGPAKWLTRWNHGEDVKPPKVYRVLDDAEDLSVIAERDEKVSRLGWERTDDSFADVYGEGYQRKPEPTTPPPARPGARPPAAANDEDEAEEQQRRAAFAAFDEVEEDEIDRLAAALAAESNPIIAEFAASAIDSLRNERELRGGRLSVEGARVALLEAFERFPAEDLARATGLAFVAERGAAEAGVTLEGDRVGPREPDPRREFKAPEPEPAPAPQPVINLTVPLEVHMPKGGKRVTTVTKHDEKGRVIEFEQRDEEGE